MRRWSIFTIASVAILGLLVMGCGSMDDTEYSEVSQTAKLVCASATTVPVKVGSKTAGKITVRNDKNKLYLTFTATYPGAFLHRVIYKVNGVKWKTKKLKKHPKSWTKTMKLRKKWKPGTKLNIKAIVAFYYKGLIIPAWVTGKYTVGECYLDAVLPVGNVDMWVKSSGAYSRLVLNLKNVVDGFDVWPGAWPGWCVEKTVYIRTGKLYSRQVVSSQDTANLPDRAKNVNWQLVNYMINNKSPKASTTDIQNAIWHVLGYIGMPSDPDAKAMIVKAKKYGKNFRPTYGDSVAVIYLSATGVQLVFLEVVL